MTGSWDEYAADWDDNETAKEYSRKVYAGLNGIVNPAGLVILDFGCGTGLLAERLARSAKRVVAVDSSQGMIAILERKKLPNVDTLAAEVTQKTVKEQEILAVKFDLIVASSVCAFLSDYESTLKVLRNLLKPNALFIQWDWLRAGEDQSHGFTKNQITASFKQVGLSVSSVSEVFSLENEGREMKVVMGIGQNA